MKTAELRAIAECASCHKPFGHVGLPFFWRVRVERWGVKLNAVQRQHGLELMLGSPALAEVMGPNEDLAVPVAEPTTFTLCENCAMEPQTIAALFESAAQKGGED